MMLHLLARFAQFRAIQVRCARARCKYSCKDESASPAMKWSTASDNCASVENPAYSCEQISVVRAAYAATDSDPDCRKPRGVVQYAPSNSNYPKSAICPFRNFSYDAIESTTCHRKTFSDSSDPSQARTKHPQRSQGRLQSVWKNSASARNARILTPDISMKSCLEATFNRVSRYAAFQSIPAAAFEFG